MKNKLLALSILVLSFVLLFNGGILLAQKAQGAGLFAPQDNVSTSFTYQGQLQQNGQPVSDTCDFRFNLYDDNYLSPNFVSGPLDRNNITVSDGYFSVILDFGNAAFTGEGRQLEIQARCPTGSGDYTPLTPLVGLTAAPYALSLRPGAVISGSVSAGAALHVTNSDTGTFASNGIEGSAQNIGVKGSGDNYGVYGQSDSGYGLYSEGAAHIQGELTWEPKLSYLSVPAAAFDIDGENISYQNDGYRITSSSSAKFYAPVELPHTATVNAMAFYWYDDAVTATITCTLYIDGLGLAGGPIYQPMAQIASTGSSGAGYGVTSDIAYATINNSNRIYYLELELPRTFSGGVAGRGVIIEYLIGETH